MSTDPIVAPSPHPETQVILSEASQTAIYAGLHRKAAYAAGIEALALRAIETGEDAPLEHIAELAATLSEALQQLSIQILQLKAKG